MAEYGLLEQLLPELSDFIEDDKEEWAYRYLETIDAMVKKFPEVRINRAILLACLIFPIVDKQVMHLTSERDKPPHLGMIQTIAKTHIDTAFNTFFQLSRKLKGELHFLISWQYKLIPLNSKAKVQYRVPMSSDFVLALKFLNIRARLDESLVPLWKNWNMAYESVKSSIPKAKPRQRFRRPRRRRR